MNRQSGFTIIELAVVVAIMGILAGITIPNLIAWAANGRVNSAARDIVSMLQRARIEAARECEFVVVNINASGDYLAFVDDGEGTGGVAENSIQDGTERTVVSGRLPAGVTLDNVPFGAGAGQTRFNSRAMPSFAGPTVLTNSRGHTVTVRLASGGNVQVE
ncbi:GspH/FimT family pseudopilin [Desulfosarcina sp.]|uniref:GspH/FimT family pseudopilin n=1 Tax=Desulfosarcina sp. TaxID=2027861 RepID=UPI003970CA0B